MTGPLAHAAYIYLGVGIAVISQMDSSPAEEVLHDAQPEKYGFIDLGEHRLRDLGRTERLFQVAHPDLEREFGARLCDGAVTTVGPPSKAKPASR